MAAFYCRDAYLYPLLFVLLPFGGEAHAQPPFYRIGAPYPPVRDPRLTTDNGIPGSGSYYFLDYPWPSLRQALQEYGLFGRRFNQTHTNATGARAAPMTSALIWVRLPSDAELSVGGQTTSQRGSWRCFVTPSLPNGVFEYEVEAHWREQGQEMRRTRSVRVSPATEAVIDLLRVDGDPSTLPLPRPLPRP